MTSGELVFRSTMLAAGLTDKELRRLRSSGGLATVRRGAYTRSHREVAADAAARHRLMVRAAVRGLAPDAVVSHVSAAVLLGLPVWGLPTSRVHVIRARRSGGRYEPGLHVHALSLAAHEIVVVDGIAITAPGRTLVDIARSSPFDAAVAMADAALRQGLIDRAGLERATLQAKGRPGVPRARRVAGFADGGSQSVGESRSRVALDRFGLPRPVLQWEVRSRSGQFLGRTDFAWPELDTVGEFDGRVKYGRLLRPGEQPGDVVFAEKRREDSLRAEGLHVVRWTWDDLVSHASFAPVVGRLRNAFGLP